MRPEYIASRAGDPRRRSASQAVWKYDIRPTGVDVPHMRMRIEHTRGYSVEDERHPFGSAVVDVLSVLHCRPLRGLHPDIIVATRQAGG